MPVYRTYVDGSGASPADREVIAAAVAAAHARHRDLDPAVSGFLAELLGSAFGPAGRELVGRIQQFSGPVMAKGLEDTALYRANRLVSLNDVGERPAPFSLPVAAFHTANAARAKTLPHAMLGTSSHDSKRGEDSRARLAALSGHAADWVVRVPGWLDRLRTQNAPAIEADDAYLFLQLLVGAWPGATSPGFADRLVEAMRKSLREARLRSTWRQPDGTYEAKVEAFVRTALDGAGGNGFLADFCRFEATLARHGALNGLIETVLKLTVPGVPDIYQGAELWEQSLVDPDNRRPVDFALRQRLLAAGGAPEAAFERFRDGAVKQAIIARLLGLRAAQAALFANGSYEPLPVSGQDAARVCAFARRHGAAALLVAVRLSPWRPDGTAAITLPADLAGWRWRDGLGDAVVEADALLAFRGPLPLLVRFGTAV
jgi:(1->4)-alpha-D-glucan 1-alpha-D-glucosylmutase